MPSDTRELNPQALHCDDPVTGLPGRGALERTLSAAIDAAERSGSAVGLVLVDIAELHLINEAHGHDVGDRVLQEAAGAVCASLPQSASLFRLAGGELAAVIADTDAGGLQELQEQLVRAVRKPLQVDRGQLLIAASSGLALFPRHAASAPELLRAACSALNDAKCVGVGAARVGSRVSDSLEHLDLVARLHRALERSELDLHFQPQIDLLRHDVTGIEALARWTDAVHGEIPPARFVKLAEGAGLSRELFRWSLRKACQQAKAWRDSGLYRGAVAVNVSPRQFLDPDFARAVERVLELYELPPEALELELTEDVAMGTSDYVDSQLNAIARMGVAVAVDDFGSGYSSLRHLKRLRLSKIKIGPSFIAEIASSHADRSIVQAVISIARGLDIRVVAEGVSSYEQAETLLALGCTTVQGWLYSKALPADALERFVESFSQPLLQAAQISAAG